MSGRTTPPTPEQGARGSGTGSITPPNQIRRGDPREPPQMGGRNNPTASTPSVRRQLQFRDPDAERRSREAQEQYRQGIDEEARDAQRRGTIVSSVPTVDALMNVPELKL